MTRQTSGSIPSQPPPSGPFSRSSPSATGVLSSSPPSNPFDTEDLQWEAVERRDSAADGIFVYCVRTTSIYCRPTCPSRRARRSNVVFLSTCDEAERAGFRACMRCKPRENTAPSETRQVDAVEVARKEVELAIREGRKQPTLTILASMAGMSPFHFHRVFKARVGTTLDVYGKRLRATGGA